MNDQRKRSAEEIEADIARARLELTSTVDELSDRLDPRAQLDAARSAATAKAQTFAGDVKKGEPKAVAIVGGALAFIGLMIVGAARRGR
ncbi:DUF3618 domain-containing protein [Georgenia sp. AZ-5]|uniref:DUF3618 domain-containing protein n=1 Tax=Georgenia sp. AZ-5 TaxID=3367526 RepID=UPI0037543451